MPGSCVALHQRLKCNQHTPTMFLSITELKRLSSSKYPYGACKEAPCQNQDGGQGLSQREHRKSIFAHCSLSLRCQKPSKGRSWALQGHQLAPKGLSVYQTQQQDCPSARVPYQSLPDPKPSPAQPGLVHGRKSHEAHLTPATNSRQTDAWLSQPNRKSGSAHAPQKLR